MLKSFLKVFSQASPAEADEQRALAVFRLLRQDAIQSKLALGVDQRAALERLIRDTRKEGKGETSAETPADEKRAQGNVNLRRTALEVMATIERENLLTPQQLDQLRQLYCKRQGVQAFADPQVTAALEMTPEQCAAVQGMLRDLPAADRREAGEAPEAQAARRAGRKQSLDKILSTLTEAQRDKWTELSGEPGRRRKRAGRRPGGPAGQRRGGAGGGARKKASLRAGRGGAGRQSSED